MFFKVIESGTKKKKGLQKSFKSCAKATFETAIIHLRNTRKRSNVLGYLKVERMIFINF